MRWYDGMPVVDERLLPSRRKTRMWELDFLRGIFIILMVMDHLFFDIGDYSMFGYAWSHSGNAGAEKLVEFCRWYWDHPIREWIHDIVLWGFFGLCGMGVVFSKNRWLHSAKILLCATIITSATIIGTQMGLSGLLMRWGVLQCLGTASLITAIIHTPLKRHPYINAGVFIALGYACWLFNTLYLNTTSFPLEPEWLCIISPSMGSPTQVSPGDYFPLFGSILTEGHLAVPYISRVFFGAALAPLLYPFKKSLLPRLDGKWCKPVCLLGRNTLWVVIVHQVAIAALLALVTFLFVSPGSWGLF